MASKLLKRLKAVKQGVVLVAGEFAVPADGSDPTSSSGKGFKSVVTEGSVAGSYRCTLGNSGSASGLVDKYQSILGFQATVVSSGSVVQAAYQLSEDEVNASGSFVVNQVQSGSSGPLPAGGAHSVKFIMHLDNSVE